MNNLYKILFIIFVCICNLKDGNAQTMSPFSCGTVMGEIKQLQ
jgi:hypothetical protein